MIYDIQKAGVIKRLSAWLLDTILLVVLITGLASVFSMVMGLDGYNAELEGHYARYEKEYSIEFEISQEEYNAMTQAQRDNYDAAYDALVADDEVLYVYNVVINMTLAIVSLSVVAAYLILEFAVPIFLKNGQTLGKKVFSIAVVRTNCVRMNNVSLFIRTLLGKCTIGTLVPVMLIVMLLLNISGLEGTLVILALAVVQLVMVIVTPTNATIHDKLADTVVVDLSTQMIFDTEQDLIEYKKSISAEKAAKKSYF